MAKIYDIIQFPLEDLIPYPDNAKIHDKEQVALLAGRILKEGFNQPIVVDKDNMIIKGHGRRLAALKLKLEKVPVIKLVDLSPAEVKAARIADNIITERAEYDKIKLKIELEDLVLNDIDLKDIGFDDEQLALKDIDFGDSGSGNDSEDFYTKKIEAPIYEITGEKPAHDELYDLTKMKALVDRIDQVDIPEDVKDFLRVAAQRHNVFSYDKIAEYYAHATPEVQKLMEESALIIIDFDQAIENGFVKLSKGIAEVYQNESE